MIHPERLVGSARCGDESRPERTPRLHHAALALFALAMLSGVWLRPLIPIDETRYVSVAWEMWHSGNWLVPHDNGEIYTDKPPLLFWLIALAWRVAGVGENVAQFVAPLFALACVGFVGPLAVRLWPDGRDTAPLACMVLAGFTVFALYGGGTAFDAMLALAVLLGIAALLRAIRDERPGGWAMFGAALAFGVYAKGPVILLHLLPPLLLYPLWTRRGERASAGQVARGAAFALLVAAVGVGVWLVPALLEGGEVYGQGALWEQSAGRVVNAFAHARPFWFYIALLPILLFPWGWSRTLWTRSWALLRSRDAGTRLCLVWIGSTFVLFSLVSGKQLHYLVPLLPAVALLFARALARGPGVGPDVRSESGSGPLHPAGLVLAAAGSAMLAGAAGWLPLDPAIFGTSPPLGMALAAVPPLLGWLAIARLPRIPAFAAGGIAALLSFNVLVGATPLGAAYDTVPLGRALAAYEPGGLAVATSRYDNEFGFAGRLHEPLTRLATPEALDDWISSHPDGAVVAREDGLHPPWHPAHVMPLRGLPYAIWSSADGVATGGATAEAPAR